MQDEVVKLSAGFPRCFIEDRNFGVVNMTDGKLTTRLDLRWSVDCRRTIKKKVIRAVEPTLGLVHIHIHINPLVPRVPKEKSANKL